MRRIMSFILASVLILALCACSNDGGEPTPEDTSSPEANLESSQSSNEESLDASDGIVIGLSLSEISDNTTKYLETYLEEADNLGVEVAYTNAQGSVDTQISDVEALIARNVDVIHIRPLDADGLVPVIQEAQKAGIPVLVSEFDINCDVDCHVIATQNMTGILQASTLIEKLETDPDLVLNVGYLWGRKSAGSSVQQRYDGFMDAMKEYIDSGRVVILDEQEANFKSDEASAYVEDWSQRYPNLNCVVAQNDEMANGAVQALKTQNEDFSSFYVLGINGTEVGIQNVKDGYSLATVNMHESDGAIITIGYAKRLAEGETFSEPIDVSEILFELVTINNLGS